MTDWSKDLDAALTSGDADYMRSMLDRVPADVLIAAAPFLENLADSHTRAERMQDALDVYDRLIGVLPDVMRYRAARARILIKSGRFHDALADAKRINAIKAEDAIGLLLQAECHERLGELDDALAACRLALQSRPQDSVIAARVDALEETVRKHRILSRTLDPSASDQASSAAQPIPAATFDPALFLDPAMPGSVDAIRIEGLQRHLSRYAHLQAPQDALSRLQDPAWLAAWDEALRAMHGRRVLCMGSELGVLGLRALAHGADRVGCLESTPLSARIASGIVQKDCIKRWQTLHAETLAEWSQEQQQASFEEFTSTIDIFSSLDEREDDNFDCVIHPRIDHSLLGTGIVKSIRAYAASMPRAATRILPAMATVYAMGIQWRYPSDFALDALNRHRWNMSPAALELGPEFWKALTPPTQVARIDFADFAEGVSALHLPLLDDGKINAIVFWFELDLGGTTISNAPGSALRCIRPAVQSIDALDVRRDGMLSLRLHITESRLYFETIPPPEAIRSHPVLDGCAPMLGDPVRDRAYATSISKALASVQTPLVLDIGAGYGVLSLIAAQAGAARVVGCEPVGGVFEIGNEIVRHNDPTGRIARIDKECRKLSIPEDLPRAADAAIFQQFDCSLIGQGILHYLAYAREHLLAPDARIVPASGIIRAMLVEYRMDEVLGIDAGLLNPYLFSPGLVPVDAASLRYRALTEPFDVFHFDFASAGPAPEQREIQIQAHCNGVASAVLFWFDLRLDETSSLSNAPDAPEPAHWKQGLQFLPEALVMAGTRIALQASHNGSRLGFQWRPDALPAEAFSKMPRFDPRMLSAANELEQQTIGLLEHCARHPDERAKVVEIAKRFAIDPAAYDLDPMVAQRFAMMLFAN